MTTSDAKTTGIALLVKIPGFSHSMRYDIEGLRALAVLAVLTNHAFPKLLPGGFAGVDIFFVISGFLIGGQLLQEIQAGPLNIRKFYARRARRIFPALALVLVCIWCVGWFVFTAPEFIALGRHILAATIFSNNILLWSESGYFDTTSLDKPLLHLWSLGIEEQFYLLIPAMLWIGAKGKVASIRWVSRLGVVSLLATMFLSDLDYPSSFYLLHTRFWELAVGVVLAQIWLRSSPNAERQLGSLSSPKRDSWEVLFFCILVVFVAVLLLAAGGVPRERTQSIRDAGLVLIVAGAGVTAFLADRYARVDTWAQCITWLRRRSARWATASSFVGILLIITSASMLGPDGWPGPQTIFPVLGAVLLISAKPPEVINKVLAAKPLVAIGGFSYPLYLWHWPAIVIFKLVIPEPAAVEMAIPLSLSFAFAWLTKTLLEDPVRFGKLGSSVFRRPPLAAVLFGLLCAGLLGSLVFENDGVPSRFPPRLRAIAEWSEVSPDTNWRVGHCYFYPGNKEDFSTECTPAKRPGVPLILLWGDSHAAQLYPGLADTQSTRPMDIAQWTAAGCPPTLRPFRGENAICETRRKTAMDGFKHLEPDTVVLGGAWERYLELGQSQFEITDALSGVIRRLKEAGIGRIVVFGPGPLWSSSLATDLFRYMARNHSNEIPDRLGHVSSETWSLDASLAAIAKAENVEYVSILSVFCNKNGCLTVGDKNLERPDLLYRDRDHLTVSGSRVLIQHSKPALFGNN